MRRTARVMWMGPGRAALLPLAAGARGWAAGGLPPAARARPGLVARLSWRPEWGCYLTRAQL